MICVPFLQFDFLSYDKIRVILLKKRLVTSTSHIPSVQNGLLHLPHELLPILLKPIHLSQNPKSQLILAFLQTRSRALVLMNNITVFLQAHVKLHGVFRAFRVLVLFLSFFNGEHFVLVECGAVRLFEIGVGCVWLEDMRHLEKPIVA